MNKDLKNIDRLFHNNLKGLQDIPPAHLWSGIEEALNSTPETSFNTGASQSKKRWFTAVAFLLLLAGIGSAVVLNNASNNNSTDNHHPIIISHQDTKTINQVAPPEYQHSIQQNPSRLLTTSPLLAMNSPVLRGEVITDFPLSADEPANSGRLTLLAEPVQAIAAQGQIQINAIAPAPSEIKEIPAPIVSNASVAAESITNIKIKKLTKRLSFTVFFAPDITTRNLEQDNSSSSSEKNEIVRTERNSALDYTIGARIDYALSKRLSIQSGISFSSNTINIASKTIFAGYDVDGTVKYRYNCSSGYAYFKPATTAAPLAAGDSTEALSSSTVLHYVNIPIALKYNYSIGRRLTLFAQAGITARLITKHSIAAVYAIGNTKEHTTDQIQGLKTGYMNGVVGLGADYSLNRHLSVSVFPSFNFATTAINRNSPVKAYPNTLSIASGIKINL